MKLDLTQILVVTIPALISGIVAIIIAYIQKGPEPPKTEKQPDKSAKNIEGTSSTKKKKQVKKPNEDAQHAPSANIEVSPKHFEVGLLIAVLIGSAKVATPEYSKRLRIALLIGIFIGIAIGFSILKLWFAPTQGASLEELSLWTFDQGTEGWQPEKQDVKPEAAALKVSLNSDGSLQGDFDFGIVDANALSGKQPRATYYAPVGHEDWSAFRTLMFDVNNLSTHDLKVMFSVSNSGCWYEFGKDQILPLGQKSTLRFDLTAPKYKTCQLTSSYTNPAPSFQDVWRFDIIFGTPEDPWDHVQGSILIDNIKLTDRIPDAK